MVSTARAGCQGKGSVMVPRRRKAMTTQTLRHSLEPFLVLRRFLGRRPITALAAASPRRTLPFLGSARQTLAVDARRVRKDVNPLALRRRGTITKP